MVYAILQSRKSPVSRKKYEEFRLDLERMLYNDLPWLLKGIRGIGVTSNDAPGGDIDVFSYDKDGLLTHINSYKFKEHGNIFLLDIPGVTTCTSFMNLLALFSDKKGYEGIRHDLVLPRIYNEYWEGLKKQGITLAARHHR